MYRQKTIINRQRRNVSQIANVQRKVRQTDKSPCKHTVKYRQNSHDEEVDKVHPANAMQLSTKFNENTFKFALQMQRYRQHTAIAQSQRSIAQSENSKLFRRQTSPFLSPKTTNPLNTKRVNRKENIYTPKVKLLYCYLMKLTILTDTAKNTSVRFKS